MSLEPEQLRPFATGPQAAEPGPVKFFHAYCKVCWDTGTVMARKLDEPETMGFAFRCLCTRGRNDPRRFPSFDSVDSANWEIER